jgi:hypothetical protein
MDTISVLADISRIWLAFLALLAVLPWGVLFYFIIKGLNKARWAVKVYSPVVRLKASQVADATGQVSAKIAQPVVAMHSTGAQVGAMTRNVLRRKHTWTSDRRA